MLSGPCAFFPLFAIIQYLGDTSDDLEFPNATDE